MCSIDPLLSFMRAQGRVFTFVQISQLMWLKVLIVHKLNNSCTLQEKKFEK